MSYIYISYDIHYLIWQRHAIFASAPEHPLPLFDDFFIPVGRHKWESERGQQWKERDSHSFLVSFLQTLEFQQHLTIIHCRWCVVNACFTWKQKRWLWHCDALNTMRLLIPDIEKRSSGPSSHARWRSPMVWDRYSRWVVSWRGIFRFVIPKRLYLGERHAGGFGISKPSGW